MINEKAFSLVEYKSWFVYCEDVLYTEKHDPCSTIAFDKGFLLFNVFERQPFFAKKQSVEADFL